MGSERRAGRKAFAGMGRGALRRIRREQRVLKHVISSGQVGRLLGSRPARQLMSQAPQRFEAASGDAANVEELCRRLDEHSLTYSRGGYSVYVPPQTGLQSLVPAAAGAYPPEAGYKFLSDPGEVGVARYSVAGPWRNLVKLRVSGDISEQILAANFLHGKGFGPRLYDVAAVRFGRTVFTALIVENAGGEPVTEPEHTAFIEELLSEIARGDVMSLHPDWSREVDYQFSFDRGQGPVIQTNVRRLPASGDLVYVDPQYFLICAPQQRLERLLATAESQVASRIGGCDEAIGSYGERRRAAKALIESSKVSVRGRTLLVPGCGLGELVAEGLAAGASWVIGWDEEPVVDAAQQILLAQGCTRFDLIPIGSGDGDALASRMPTWLAPAMSRSIVFARAVTRSPQALTMLESTEFDVLVAEGCAGESADDVAMAISGWGGSGAVAAPDSRRNDGGTGRPIVVARSHEPDEDAAVSVNQQS